MWHDDVFRARVAAVMARLAVGDRRATIILYEDCFDQLAATVRRILRRRGVDHVHAEDLSGLVFDACVAVAECAGGWDPSGAPPWWWAEARIAAAVDRWLGHFSEGLDGEPPPPTAAPQPWSGPDPRLYDVLEELAAVREDLALVAEALRVAASSERDRALLLEYLAQRRAGDVSPAVTVARLFGMTEDAVRQAASRTRARLRRLAVTDARFAALAELGLLR